MKDLKDTCVYFRINPVKQEVFYVGIGNKTRPYQNKKNSRSKYWHRIVEKHGYQVIVVHKNLTWEEACQFEIKYIAQIGRRDKKKGPLVNFTDGGEGNKGRILSEETRNKISNSNKGHVHSEEHKNKISNSLKGHIISDHNRNEISKIHKGKIISQETRDKISKGNTGKIPWNKGIKIKITE